MKVPWQKERSTGGETAVQLRSGGRSTFGRLESYVPLLDGETALYREVREAVPVVDAAICKLIRLTGGVRVACGNERAEQGLQRFLREVPVGRGQRGINAFLDCYLDSLLTCGRAVGEIVPDAEGREIAAVLCADVSQVEVREGDNPLEFCLCGVDGGGRSVPLEYQDLLLFTPLNPEMEHPYGVSMLRSMPYLTGLLLKIYDAMGKNWDRCGNVRFAVTYKPQDGELDRGAAQERAEQIAALTHDLKTPLSIIQGNADLLAEDALSADQQTQVEAILRGTDRAQQYLAALRTACAPPATRETFPSHTLVSGLAETARALCAPAGVQLILNEQWQGTLCAAQCDLLRAAENLLDNAVRYTPRGGTVTLLVTKEKQDFILRVTDTGPGFTAEALARAGELLYTEAARSDTAHQGFGLYFARRVALSHSGTLRLSNTPGGCAELRLPICEQIEK